MLPRYVLVTPARNEAQFIELTLQSVIAQTVRPIKWVIVNDGSTDDTEAIIRAYAANHPWIELVCIPERKERSFAGKVLAFNAGYERVFRLKFDVLACLDADISFEPDYFSFLLDRLAADPALGLVGTPFQEAARQSYDYRFVNIEHVSGACQIFRRECFAEIGGYKPLPLGGIDHLAVITARMKGWKTRTFTGKFCQHHRHMGTAQRSLLVACFRYGLKDYVFGNHPLWQVCRTTYQMTRKPYVIGGLALATGYLWAASTRLQRVLSHEAMVFQRREQMQRLRHFVFRNRSLSLATSTPSMHLEDRSERMNALNPTPGSLSLDGLAVTQPTGWSPLPAANLNPQLTCAGRLIINADDWGLDMATTDRVLECFQRGALSSASGMVFMECSARAAAIAADHALDIGLHLNLSAPFTASGIPAQLAEHHQKVRAYLRSNRFAQVFYHPGLSNSFEYVVARQIEEFARLYGRPPDRIDGHHHMHLCANVLFPKLLPEGIIVRRNLSFIPGEKSWINRRYRILIDRKLAMSYSIADHLFSLRPIQPESRLQYIFSLARQSTLELEAHPVLRDQYSFLCSGELPRLSSGLPVAPRYKLKS